MEVFFFYLTLNNDQVTYLQTHFAVFNIGPSLQSYLEELWQDAENTENGKKNIYPAPFEATENTFHVTETTFSNNIWAHVDRV